MELVLGPCLAAALRRHGPVDAASLIARRLLERGRRMAVQVEDEVLQGLTAGERRELLKLLRRALDSAPSQPLWSAEEGD